MIISLVAILMLLSDYTMEENEIDWFFQNGENKVNNDKFKAHFLGWKMGSASGKSKDKRKNKTTDPNEEMQITLIDFASSDHPFKSSPNWKTLILADSTIHYIPLEEMATVRNSDNSFIPEDAMDPFYLDIDPQDDMFNNELYNNQFFYKVPTEYPMHQLVPNPNMFPKKTSKSPRIYYPIGLSFHKKLMPLLDPYRRRAQHPMIYHVKPKNLDICRR
ncbi:uncharacterized protein [Halyomorpha halys]|uniref:uncharacterized protein isoform X2 n=1 Tax=Halyomorpha halys TaxID=286706 RepID=UPI000D0C9575|nr:uncharacterized protein LOC106691281 isoform X2 [Halyomorpha halys]